MVVPFYTSIYQVAGEWLGSESAHSDASEFLGDDLLAMLKGAVIRVIQHPVKLGPWHPQLITLIS